MVQAAPALFIIALLILLPIAAGASPPDPTWLAGIYDDADYDDVIWVLSNTELAFQTAPPPLAGEFPDLVSSIVRKTVTATSWVALASLRPRSPPPA